MIQLDSELRSELWSELGSELWSELDSEIMENSPELKKFLNK